MSSAKAEIICVICMSEPDPAKMASLACGHHFCYECILKWSKNENTCPHDKIKFKEIKYTDDQGRIKTKKVADKKQVMAG
jgi:hypothetical protein